MENQVPGNKQEPLWQPDPARVGDCQMRRFMDRAAREYAVELDDYHDLHRWSVANSEDFWSLVWQECGVIASTKGARIVEDKEKMPGAKWFPDARLNFAENLLRRRDRGLLKQAIKQLTA